MADVEVQLFLRRPEIPESLLDTAWYLHGVASVDAARERYSLARQRQAFLVSAHIFDLALQESGWTGQQRLAIAFGAAIGYRRGGRDPNATAIMKRVRADIIVDGPIEDHLGSLALEAGIAFLGFEARSLFGWFSRWRRQLKGLASASDLPDLAMTAFGAAEQVVLGAEDLLVYFAHGDLGRLDSGKRRLAMASAKGVGLEDIDSRWVGAHLLSLAREAEPGSLWNETILPPNVPRIARQAFTVGSPAVMTLWEPQRELLTGSVSPFDPLVRRTVLAVPTSGGKSLLAQILAVEHLTRSSDSVCYVAPTRSLGREIRGALSVRLRMLQKEVEAEQADFPSVEEIFAGADYPSGAEIMTPERLLHLLRHDAHGVLSRFGLFIFDEAQLMKERGRGFAIESAIALLDHFTGESSHKVVLISAAMGNVGAIAQWLSSNGPALQHESEWRGPRRLHAAFTTRAHWDGTTVETIRGKTWPYRLTTELSGEIRLRLADGRTSYLGTDESTGWVLVRKSKTGYVSEGGLPKDSIRSTKNVKIAAEMIVELGEAGSVLVVTGTRRQAQALAAELALVLDSDPKLSALVDFVMLQLGDSHPLVGALRHGVGFHHAGLPLEVLEALESAVRDDTLRYLTCTSTLTDGVNLPVRTVVIYDQTYEGQPEDTRLRGARLVNAMGRAGRAGRETEGWIVLVRAAAPTESDFQDLNPSRLELEVTSSLISEEALEAFAEFERAQREDADAVFRLIANTPATAFAAFVWLMLAVEENRGADPSFVDMHKIVDSTLASTQSLFAREACMSTALAVQSAYARTDPEARQRWSRTGTSVSSARVMDEIAAGIAASIEAQESAGILQQIQFPEIAVEFIDLDKLLHLPEASRVVFRRTTNGSPIEVSLQALLKSWLAGTSLTNLADIYLSDVPDAAWRIEQMVDAVTGQFEHYLAWITGAIVELVNSRFADEDNPLALCPDLGRYVRYGVGDPIALLLMTSGVRSRRLARIISDSFPSPQSVTEDELRDQLGQMTVGDWRDRFDATSSEIIDLLEFTRIKRRSLLRRLLETGVVELEAARIDLADTQREVDLKLNSVGEGGSRALAVFSGEKMIATFAAKDQSDLAAIMETGMNLVVRTGSDTRIQIMLDTVE